MGFTSISRPVKTRDRSYTMPLPRRTTAGKLYEANLLKTLWSDSDDEDAANAKPAPPASARMTDPDQGSATSLCSKTISAPSGQMKRAARSYVRKFRASPEASAGENKKRKKEKKKGKKKKRKKRN